MATLGRAAGGPAARRPGSAGLGGLRAAAMAVHAPRLPRRWALVAAFAAVYLIWGSTYLAIRVAVGSFPPFLMAGSRFLVAGGLLYLWLRLRGAAPPGRGHWRAALVVGGLLLLGGNGLVTWSEQALDSGLTALIVATVPLWMALFAALAPGGRRPGGRALAGLALGFAGAALLVAPLAAGEGTAGGSAGAAVGAGGVATGVAALAVVLATVSWATGSVLSPRVGLPASPGLATALEMLAGGALLFGLGLASGEAARLDLAGVTPAAWAAWLYLVVFGSIVAFSAYVWLLGHTSATRAATYAYVNPVVAVVLGAAVLQEPITARMWLAAPLIVAGVMLILAGRGQAEDAGGGLAEGVETLPRSETDPA
jgi:drug/metabolite transporter (DMT)-like permease